MVGRNVDPCGRTSRLAHWIAHVFTILVFASCRSGPGETLPGAASPPAFPRRTPITVATELPSRTAEEAPASMAASPVPQSDTPAAHTVVPGDTLLGIARLYDVPMAAIQLENEMAETTTVRVGQELSIPPKKAWKGSSPYWIVHVVKPGDTLIGIAHGYDLEVESLQAVNGLADADLIGAGQTLILPLVGPPTELKPAPSVVPEPTVTQAPVEPSPAPTASPTVSDTSGASISPTLGASPTLASPSAAPPTDLAEWPLEIARLINEERAGHGLEALTYNGTLQQSAQAHANDCARRGWCGHTGSDGADIRTRITRIGYEGSGWAECWAQVQSPQRAVEVWMDETPPNDPHRRTLLSTWLTEIGIGVSAAEWGTYIIADFGRP